MAVFNILIQNGWNKEIAPPFNEMVAKQATDCYTYTNAKHTHIAILTVPDKNLIRIRLSASNGHQFNYFEMSMNNNEEAILKAIDAVKEEADINNYFAFYFDLQNSGEVSILAWEQWESNYQ